MELWATIEGDNVKYKISSLGRVFSVRENGEKPIKLCQDGRGYLNFTVLKNGKRGVLLVHREVAKAFIKNDSGGNIVRHLNDIKTDNRVENLRWGTHLDNALDAVRNKKSPICNNLGDNIIMFMYSAPYNCCQIARKFNVSPSMVSKIRNGRSYSWLTGHERK